MGSVVEDVGEEEIADDIPFIEKRGDDFRQSGMAWIDDGLFYRCCFLHMLFVADPAAEIEIPVFAHVLAYFAFVIGIGHDFLEAVIEDRDPDFGQEVEILEEFCHFVFVEIRFHAFIISPLFGRKQRFVAWISYSVSAVFCIIFLTKERMIMKIYNVEDKEFSLYGKVWKDIPSSGLDEALEEGEMDEKGVIYKRSFSKLESLTCKSQLEKKVFGYKKCQMGYCNGHNRRLNCMEYHKGSEVNYSDDDFILLLARYEDIKDGLLDSASVKAFYVKKHTFVEIYPLTLHYAPVSKDSSSLFRVLVSLPLGTNEEIEKEDLGESLDEKCLFMKDKWLLAHRDSAEAKNGAYIGIEGKNIDLDVD